ncbi:major facilitator superfamily domain-containing protein [Helicostylum pulchrum]|nr:major facilitator superfamily domain-containing protein [Helicostylum pulchrum]
MPPKKAGPSFVWIIPLILKIDFQLLPIFCVFYLLSSLDRSSPEFSEISGLTTDLNISNTQTQWSLAVFYFAVIIFDIPSNIIMRRWKPSYWLGIIMGVWGIISTVMAACTSFTGLVIARLIISICEAGIFPGVVYYLSFWYTRSELGKRLGCLWSCRCLAGALGGLFAYGVSCITSNKYMHVWQWTFIIQGSPCVVVALIISWYLPNDIGTAKFLMIEERNIIIRKLEADVGIFNYDDWSWDQFGTILMDVKTYAFILIYISGAATVQGATLFLPTLISDLNQPSVLSNQLLMAPPYILAIILTIGLSYSSDRFYERSYHLVSINALAIAALLIQMFLPTSYRYTSYIATCFFVAAVYAHVPVKIAWAANTFFGFTRRAVALGIIFSLGSIGGAIGSQMLHDRTSGKFVVLTFLVFQSFLTLVTRCFLDRENKRRKKLNSDAREFQLYKFNGRELVGDRHPDFNYTL